jgi:hypothetical protein
MQTKLQLMRTTILYHCTVPLSSLSLKLYAYSSFSLTAFWSKQYVNKTLDCQLYGGAVHAINGGSVVIPVSLSKDSDTVACAGAVTQIYVQWVAPADRSTKKIYQITVADGGISISRS